MTRQYMTDLAWHSGSAAAVGVVVPADSMAEAVT
jgi:hypothetical protein